MSESRQPPEGSPFDPELWVRNDRGQTGYLGAKSFITSVGRFLTWWPHADCALGTSLYELSECSPSAALWLRGYLEGSSPGAWFDDPDFDYADDDPRTKLWWESVLGYQLTGTWVVGRECDVCGSELLPSSPAGAPLCPDHGGGIHSSWPTVVPSP